MSEGQVNEYEKVLRTDWEDLFHIIIVFPEHRKGIVFHVRCFLALEFCPIVINFL